MGAYLHRGDCSIRCIVTVQAYLHASLSMQSTKALAHLAKVPEGYQLAHGDIECQGLERFCEQCLVSPVDRI